MKTFCGWVRIIHTVKKYIKALCIIRENVPQQPHSFYSNKDLVGFCMPSPTKSWSTATCCHKELAPLFWLVLVGFFSIEFSWSYVEDGPKKHTGLAWWHNKCFAPSVLLPPWMKGNQLCVSERLLRLSSCLPLRNNPAAAACWGWKDFIWKPKHFGGERSAAISVS